MAGPIWKFAVVLVFGIGAMIGVLDYDLFKMFGAPGTITDWLREHPLWAVIPLLVLQAFVVWLVGHLWFGWPP